MSTLKEYAGIFMYYFIAQDPIFPFQYAYGIRENKFGLVNIVRTGPIHDIQVEHNVIITYDLFYKLGELITDQEERVIYLTMFANLTLPIFDNELIGPPVTLTLQ
jgi:hypothetical protein